MKVVRFASAERYEPHPQWERTSFCAQPDISVEHFVKPPLHASPEHSHPSAQVLIVVSGRISIETPDDGVVELGPNDTAYIPGDQPHIVRNVLEEPSVGIDIFVPGRSFDFWLKRDQPPV